jgi:hypothetical protein
MQLQLEVYQMTQSSFNLFISLPVGSWRCQLASHLISDITCFSSLPISSVALPRMRVHEISHEFNNSFKSKKYSVIPMPPIMINA